jgi:hypothetical protein
MIGQTMNLGSKVAKSLEKIPYMTLLVNMISYMTLKTFSFPI